jgi:hypothetical protein
MRLEEGVLNGVLTLPLSWRSWRGVVPVWKSWAVRFDVGVAAKRAVVGVMVVMACGIISVVVRCLLGVAAATEAPATALARVLSAAVDLDGVRPRRSKSPSTRPSF